MGAAEDEIVRYHHRLNGHIFEQTPEGSGIQRNRMCCSPQGHKESGTTQQVNNDHIIFFMIPCNAGPVSTAPNTSFLHNHSLIISESGVQILSFLGSFQIQNHSLDFQSRSLNLFLLGWQTLHTLSSHLSIQNSSKIKMLLNKSHVPLSTALGVWQTAKKGFKTNYIKMNYSRLLTILIVLPS